MPKTAPKVNSTIYYSLLYRVLLPPSLDITTCKEAANPHKNRGQDFLIHNTAVQNEFLLHIPLNSYSTHSNQNSTFKTTITKGAKDAK